MHKEDKTKLNQLTNWVKAEISKFRNNEWDQKLESLNAEDLSLWEMVRVLSKADKTTKIPPIKKN